MFWHLCLVQMDMYTLKPMRLTNGYICIKANERLKNWPSVIKANERAQLRFGCLGWYPKVEILTHKTRKLYKYLP